MDMDADKLRDDAIDVWRQWLVVVHKPRRIEKIKVLRKTLARANANLAAGNDDSLALRNGGSVACWGDNEYGPAPPDGIPGDFVAIAAGADHSLALRVDGSIACFGYNEYGQAPPDGIPGDFVAIAAGDTHSLALRVDGSVACWGLNNDGEAPPAGVSGPFRATQADL